MEAPHPIVESMHDREGRVMVLRVNSARQYEATAMAAAYGIKRLDNYWTTKDAVEVVEAVSRLQGIPVSGLKVVVNTGPKHLHGTWVHEDVALHLAAWLSKDFYAFMLQTFRRYIKGEITTEESRAAKKALDARHEQDRIKYEQAQKQLQIAQKDFAVSEGERKLAVANQQKSWRQVDHATAEVDDLKKQLGLKRQTAAKRKRGHECKVFLQGAEQGPPKVQRQCAGAVAGGRGTPGKERPGALGLVGRKTEQWVVGTRPVHVRRVAGEEGQPEAVERPLRRRRKRVVPIRQRHPSPKPRDEGQAVADRGLLARRNPRRSCDTTSVRFQPAKYVYLLYERLL